MAEPCLLIGDLGGTNARFALAMKRQNRFEDELSLSCADYPTAEDAIDHYLAETGRRRPDVICLAVAGPIVNQTVRFLNNNWTLGAGELAGRYPGARVRLLNDFEAVAYSLPLLESNDLQAIGLPGPCDLAAAGDFTVGVVGPGTGLGVGGLLSREGRVYPLVGEGGHAGFAPETKVQLAVLEQLRGRFERVSNERLLSGPGLQNVFWALQRIHGRPTESADPAEIFRRAQGNEDEIASETVQLFFEALGQVSGNLALALGTHEGIHIAGGIVRRYPELLKSSSFRSGFENKGRHRSLMEQIPTCLVTYPQPGLLGASFMARELHSHAGRRKARK